MHGAGLDLALPLFIAIATLMALAARMISSRLLCALRVARGSRWRRPIQNILMIAVALAAFAPPVRAQSPDPADIRAGASLFRQKADCQACHGWAGDGRKMDNQMPDGANLRETKLKRADLITVIKCGRPGSGMPAFDRLAYSDGRCAGLKQADLRASGLTLADPASPLIQRDIEAIADFLFAKVIGKGPVNRVSCIEYWGSEIDLCKELPN
jgi:mono/diheme cytochrome c family protein